MRTLLITLIILAAADMVLGGALLFVVAVQYRRVRRLAISQGQPLPSATGQFIFVGGMVAAGVVVLVASVVMLLLNS